MEWYTILEILMIVSFGASWPAAVIKSFKARTTKGKSLFFVCMILFGYACGIVAKIVTITPSNWYVLFFYVLNFCMVGCDLILYFRNRMLDKKRAAGENV